MPGFTSHSEKYICDQVFSLVVSLIGVLMRIECEMLFAEHHILELVVFHTRKKGTLLFDFDKIYFILFLILTPYLNSSVSPLSKTHPDLDFPKILYCKNFISKHQLFDGNPLIRQKIA